MKDFLADIGITQEGHKGKDNTYIIDIEDSDEYGKIYSRLDKAEELEEQDESSTINVHNSTITYMSDDYQITIIADFDQDTYKLVCKKYKGDK